MLTEMEQTEILLALLDRAETILGRKEHYSALSEKFADKWHDDVMAIFDKIKKMETEG